MSFSDWLLALHVLAAFALIAALVLVSSVIVAGWASDRPRRVVALGRVAAIGTRLIGPAAGLALLLGLWLAIDLDAYDPWDVWIVVSIVLWLIGVATGARVGAHYDEAGELAQRLAGGDEPSAELAARLRDRRAATLHAVTVAAFAAILVLMIYKPGA